MSIDIGQVNCFFNLIIHEFEGLLFSKPNAFKAITNNNNLIKKVIKIRSSFKTPEHINNSAKTAPSKRLARIFPKYAKVRNGTIVSKETGIEVMMKECRHLAEWIYKIKEF
ncbi:MAG: DUF4276 family protein [Tissierellia bacterium]|nr:DUF4276 family protein [Tissierellia bacterium]